MLKHLSKKIPTNAVLYCFISLGIIVTSLVKKDVDYSQFENRTMEYFHWPKTDTIISGEWFDAFEKYNLDQVIGRDTLVETNSRMLSAIGKRQINGMTAYDDGTILQIAYDFPKIRRLGDDTVNNTLVSIRDAAESYGGQFYYMNNYPRHLFFWEGFPYHANECFEDYLAANTNDLKTLSDAGINVVDTYYIMQDHSDEYLYFHTDHHYTYRGAYYSYLALLDSINKHNPNRKTLTFPSFDSMNIIRPHGYFWGSLISQIGDRKYEGTDYLEYALPDDYPTIYERFESGELSDMPLIRDDSIVEYGWFMNGDYGNTVIRTHRSELPSILIIGYSFTDALELMAVYDFNEMHSIDPRQFDGDIVEYVKSSKCDYVVVQDVITLE